MRKCPPHARWEPRGPGTGACVRAGVALRENRPGFPFLRLLLEGGSDGTRVTPWALLACTPPSLPAVPWDDPL